MSGDGPRVVAVGGGHGLAATLRAVRRYAGELTAVVSVADDGGSSGRLRRQLDIMPPGDLRKCLVALAEEDSVLAAAFEQRFAAEELVGHALGNLVIAGLMEACGDPQKGLDEAARLLGAVGRVVPAAAEPVVLKAESESGEIEGQTEVMAAGHIHRVSLVPTDPPASPVALAELARADQVVMGPGSLFTSILAAVAVPALADAIRRSPGAARSTWPTSGPRDARRPASTWPTTWPHWLPTASTSTWWWPTPRRSAWGTLAVEVVSASLAKANGRAHDPARLAVALRGLVG